MEVNNEHSHPYRRKEQGEHREAFDSIRQRFDEGWGAWFECKEGWYPLIARLDAQLKELVPDYTLLQVKEKFGGLRYYAQLDSVDDTTAEAFWALIHEAEAESFKICERCGRPGKLSKKGYWSKTVCSACAAELGFEGLPGRPTE